MKVDLAIVRTSLTSAAERIEATIARLGSDADAIAVTALRGALDDVRHAHEQVGQ
jgi:hypothetical protein